MVREYMNMFEVVAMVGSKLSGRAGQTLCDADAVQLALQNSQSHCCRAQMRGMGPLQRSSPEVKGGGGRRECERRGAQNLAERRRGASRRCFTAWPLPAGLAARTAGGRCVSAGFLPHAAAASQQVSLSPSSAPWRSHPHRPPRLLSCVSLILPVQDDIVVRISSLLSSSCPSFPPSRPHIMADDTATEDTPITFTIKASNDAKFTLTLPASTTVSELKNKLAGAEYADTPADRQRLIYSGRVLKDNETLATYKIKDGHTVHLVKSAASNQRQTPAAQSTSATPGAAAGQGIPGVPTNFAAGTGNNPLAGLTGARYAGFAQLPGAGLFGPDGGVSPSKSSRRSNG